MNFAETVNPESVWVTRSHFPHEVSYKDMLRLFVGPVEKFEVISGPNRQRNRDMVIECLRRADNPVRAVDIRDATGIPPKTLLVLLNVMTAGREIVHTGMRGSFRYRLP